MLLILIIDLIRVDGEVSELLLKLGPLLRRSPSTERSSLLGCLLLPLAISCQRTSVLIQIWTQLLRLSFLSQQAITSVHTVISVLLIMAFLYTAPRYSLPLNSSLTCQGVPLLKIPKLAIQIPHECNSLGDL